MLKGYADEHVNAAIVHALWLRQMDIATVQEVQGEGTDDAEVLAEALRDERVLLTCDEDFLILAADYGSQGRIFAPISLLAAKSPSCWFDHAIDPSRSQPRGLRRRVLASLLSVTDSVLRQVG